MFIANQINNDAKPQRGGMSNSVPLPQFRGAAAAVAAHVPEGRPTIAQRFNAGFSDKWEKVPKGRLTICSAVPSGLMRRRTSPGVKTRGYSRDVFSGQAKASVSDS